MKLVTKNSQIVVGGVYNKYEKKTRYLAFKNVEVKGFTFQNMIRDESGVHYYPEDSRCDLYWELVSYPPRRPVTWEWVKENIDQVPGLKLWGEVGSQEIESVSNRNIYLKNGVCLGYYPEFEAVYIDPPHPEVPDVQPPWAEEKKSLWWVVRGNGDVFLSDNYMTDARAKETFLRNYNRYQPVTRPVHEGPDENAWRSV